MQYMALSMAFLVSLSEPVESCDRLQHQIKTVKVDYLIIGNAEPSLQRATIKTVLVR